MTRPDSMAQQNDYLLYIGILVYRYIGERAMLAFKAAGRKNREVDALLV